MILGNINSSTLSDKNRLVAAVYMITYNQEKFIEQAVESVINQKADFNYKLFIGEDCSTDKTREICLLLKEKYPHKIDLLLNETNLGVAKNAKSIFKHSFAGDAEYIALIEGDDYWTDPLKLRKQVDFLEKNRDYSMIFHKVQEVGKDGEKTETILTQPEEEKTYDIKDLAAGNFIHTPSVVFRKNFNELPEWIDVSPLGDYPLHMLNAQYGLIKYLPEEMAVYRVGSGIWSSQSKIYKYINTLITLKLLISYFSNLPDVQAVLTKQYNSWLDELQTVKVQNIICYDPEKISDHFTYKALVSMILKKIRKKIKAGYSK